MARGCKKYKRGYRVDRFKAPTVYRIILNDGLKALKKKKKKGLEAFP